VYGNPSILPVPETHQTHPITSYGVHKAAAEHYLNLYDSVYGVPSIVLRCSNVYGEGQQADRSQGIGATALVHAAEDRPVTIFGDGSGIRGFIYIDDVVNVVFAMAERSGVDDPPTSERGSERASPNYSNWSNRLPIASCGSSTGTRDPVTSIEWCSTCRVFVRYSHSTRSLGPKA
jgi:hypothetical protein